MTHKRKNCRTKRNRTKNTVGGYYTPNEIYKILGKNYKYTIDIVQGNQYYIPNETHYFNGNVEINEPKLCTYIGKDKSKDRIVQCPNENSYSLSPFTPTLELVESDNHVDIVDTNVKGGKSTRKKQRKARRKSYRRKH